MKFNKQNAKYYGRRGGLAAQAKKAREKIDGFEMVEILHVKYRKCDAIEWGYADDYIFPCFMWYNVYRKKKATKLKGD